MQETKAKQTELVPVTGQSISISGTDKLITNPPLPEQPVHIGFRGYLRMARVFVSFFLFMLRAFLNTRDWLDRKRERTSEQRHEEGIILREKFLKLGPTFI